MIAPVLEPESTAEAADMIRAGAAFPCGRRTRLARHFPEAAPVRWLSFRRLNRILSLDPEDQTCVIEPGVSEQELDQALAPHGLELGAAAPNAATGTLGGLFLAPDYSLLRAVHGPPRDQVLAAAWLLADATPVRSGARVVKSVAGYDVTRLFLGARGRLAACTELTLRLRPRPRHPLWYEISLDRLPAWLHPDPRRRLPARLLLAVSGRIYAQTDGVEIQAPGDRPCPPAEGMAAFEHCRAQFSMRAQRAAVDPAAAGALAAAAPAADLLTATFAADDASAVCRQLRISEEQQRRIPQPANSPWLERLQRACAPSARFQAQS